MPFDPLQKAWQNSQQATHVPSHLQPKMRNKATTYRWASALVATTASICFAIVLVLRLPTSQLDQDIISAEHDVSPKMIAALHEKAEQNEPQFAKRMQQKMAESELPPADSPLAERQMNAPALAKSSGRAAPQASSFMMAAPVMADAVNDADTASDTLTPPPLTVIGKAQFIENHWQLIGCEQIWPLDDAEMQRGNWQHGEWLEAEFDPIRQVAIALQNHEPLDCASN